eukprot:7317643-Alexandrium_andersonii.AAC.1
MSAWPRVRTSACLRVRASACPCVRVSVCLCACVPMCLCGCVGVWTARPAARQGAKRRAEVVNEDSARGELPSARAVRA